MPAPPPGRAAAGALVDTALRPLGGRRGTSTTYRLVARRWPV
jgi:hypothetical protein